eukprot:867157-Prymnesium_polylepis.2
MSTGLCTRRVRSTATANRPRSAPSRDSSRMSGVCDGLHDESTIVSAMAVRGRCVRCVFDIGVFHPGQSGNDG